MALPGVTAADILLNVLCGSIVVMTTITTQTHEAAAHLLDELRSRVVIDAATASSNLHVSIVSVSLVKYTTIVPSSASPPPPPYNPVTPSPDATGEMGGMPLGVIIAGGAGVVTLIFLLLCVACCLRRKKRKALTAANLRPVVPTLPRMPSSRSNSTRSVTKAEGRIQRDSLMRSKSNDSVFDGLSSDSAEHVEPAAVASSSRSTSGTNMVQIDVGRTSKGQPLPPPAPPRTRTRGWEEDENEGL